MQPEPQPELFRDGARNSLTLERWQQIKEIFGLALECEPERRGAVLQEACGGDESLRAEVQSLLTAAESQASATSEVFHSVAPPSSPQPPPNETQDPMLGRRIGAYRLERRIGYGGMASVYLAARADEEYRKQVAFKVLRPDLDSAELLKRFRNERQTLAALEHPNIVKLLDGGSTEEGLPYLVMDYVDGRPIDEYCDAHKLTVERRLRLFCAVCEAAGCAHQNNVIHRDLKPNNILVTDEGIPKLLDFGIAKVLVPQDPSQAPTTHTVTRYLTPAYASPEQVRGEPATAATDVYSLGVVLYELLTGHRPYRLKQRTPAEIERAICEQEPESPSTAIDRVETEQLPDGTTATKTAEDISRTREGEPAKLRRNLRGDLDNILLKALQKDSKRRYPTVEEFEQDIQRHLNHKPVQARPGTLAYRTSKFVPRHKTEAIASAAVVLVLAGAIGFSYWTQRQAAEKARAELAIQRSGGRRSVAVLGFRNLSTRADTAWLSTALSEMLTTELSAGGKLRTIPSENVAQTKINLSLPETDSLSRETLGRVYRNMGSDLVVLGSYLDMGGSDRSVRLDMRVQDAALGETVASMAETGNETSLPDLVTHAGAELRAKLGISAISPVESAAARAAFASEPEATRLFAEGVARLRVYDALDARDQLEKAVHADPSFAMAHSALAEAYSNLGYQAKATDEAKKAFKLAGNLPREQHLWIEGRYYETSGEWDKAVDVFHTLFNFFPDNLDYGLHLAKAEIEAGKLDDSQKTIDAMRKQTPLGSQDPRVDITEADVAQNREDYSHEAQVAIQAQRKAEAIGARLLVAQTLYIQGHAAGLLGDPRKSIVLSSEARQIFASAGDHFREAHTMVQIARASARANDLPAAETAYQEALETYHRIGNKADESGALMGIGTVHLFQRDFADAVSAYQQSLALSREIGASQNLATVHNLALAEKDEGHLALARHDFEEVLPIAQRSGDKGLIAGCLINLAHVVAAQGDMVKARKLAGDSVEVRHHSGSKPRLGEVVGELADIEMAGGDVTAAEKNYSEALQIFTEAKQDFYASSAMFGLGDVMMVRGDLSGARKKHEAALAIRQKEHGSVRELFDSRVRAADLSLEQGQPAEAEAGVRQALKEYAAQDEPAARIEADVVLGRCLIAQNKIPEAQEVVDRDTKLMAGSEDWISRISFNILSSQLLTASGKSGEAINQLQASLEKSRKSGFGQLEFEARLALGEAEIKAGHTPIGRAQLASLEHDARAKGFLLIAHKASVARSSGSTVDHRGSK